ncbi:MAG: CocE/NonD family hydrolase [Thermoplasmatota archaeon]
MRDGIGLATDVFSPSDGGQRGSILFRTPYDKSDPKRYTEWAESGWNGIGQDVRGRYLSEGVSQFPIFWEAAADGYDTVQWIARQNFSNGKVATYGNSAMGVVQYFMAGADPPNLTCQFIRMAPPNMYSDAAYQGGQYKLSTIGSLMSGQSYEYNKAVWDNENYTTDFWDNVTLSNKWQMVNVPAVHIGGWYDAFSEGTIEGFMGYNYHGGDGAKGRSKLIMGPWTHGGVNGIGRIGEIDFPDNANWYYEDDMFSDMLDKYMTNTSNDFDNWPTVQYYVMGDADDPEAPGMEWRSSAVWPIPSNETPMYLHGNGSLNGLPPLSDNESFTYRYDPKNPVPSMGGQNIGISSGPYDQRSVENRDDVLTFTSGILDEPIEATGKIKAKIFVSSDKYDTDFTVKITDVYPDGRSMLVTDGVIRMRNRNGTDHWEFMDPGEIYEVEVDLWSTSYVWNTGHRIRVAVSSSNYPRFLPNPNTKAGIYGSSEYEIARNTLHLDYFRPSSIILPVVGELGNMEPVVQRSPDRNSIVFNDTESMEFSVRATDEDISNLSYEWHVDGMRIDGAVRPNFTYQAMVEGDTAHIIGVDVRDQGRPPLTTSVWWNVRIRNISNEIVIHDHSPSSPVVVFGKGNGILNFTINVSDEDPYPNTIIWLLDGIPVGEGLPYQSLIYDHTWVGNHSLKVVVSDDYGSTSIEWLISIMDVEGAPVITERFPEMRNLSFDETDDGRIEFSISALDPDNDTLMVTWSVNGRDAQGEGYLFIFRYDHNSSGSYLVRALISDGTHETSIEWSVTIVDINRPPEIVGSDPMGEVTVRVNQTVHFSILIFDPDPDDVLFYDWYMNETSIRHGSGTNTSIFILDTSNYSPGNYVLKVLAWDEGGLHTSVSWILHIIPAVSDDDIQPNDDGEIEEDPPRGKNQNENEFILITIGIILSLLIFGGLVIYIKQRRSKDGIYSISDEKSLDNTTIHADNDNTNFE